MKRAFIYIITFSIVAFIAVNYLISCASIQSLKGGPRDSIPPRIVAINPHNYATNMPTIFGNNKIFIEFDEYVQLKDQQKEFFTSPAMKKKPLISLRGRGVVIQIRDTLRDSTTYSLNFGSTIRDNNEGNILNSVRYVFSTGSEIDSMVVSGYTADSYKADSVSKSYIWFYPVDSLDMSAELDSTIFNHKPSVIARAENNGIFIAQNLKPIRYRAYAIEDKNDNGLYDPSEDQVGFLDDSFNPMELPAFGMWHDSTRHYVTADPQLYFRMFTDVAFKRQILQESSRPKQHQALLYFGAAHPKITSIEFDSIPSKDVIIDYQTVGRDTIALWFNHPSAELPDTIKGRMIYFKHDSINNLVPDTTKLKLSWRLVESKEQVKEREKQEKERKAAEAAGEEYTEPKKENPFVIKMVKSGDINPELGLEWEFDYPLTKLDSTAITMIYKGADSVAQTRKLSFERDTLNMRKWRIKGDFKELGSYQFTVPEGALTNVAGEANDSIGVKYSAMDPEKFSKVLVNLTAADPATRYIVEMLDKNNKLLQQKRDVTAGVVEFNYVKPSDVRFRVVEDKNGNGKWDTGNVVERRTPERAEQFIDEKGLDLFTLKANWEVEIAMDMDALFAPVTMESLIEMLDKREVQRRIRETEKLLKARKAKQDQENNQMNNTNNTGGMFGAAKSML